MALRFRKSIKIAPGIRLNVSKGGVSTSIGGRGATVNISKKGTRVTAGIPGSGLSASHLFKPANKQGRSTAAREYSSTEWAVSLALVALFAAFIAYKASGAFSFFAGAVATAIPAYFTLRWMSKRKRDANPAEYWAGKSREIQKAHEALPDAAKVTPSEPQDRTLGSDTPQNIYSVTIPESATRSVLDAINAESENRISLDTLGLQAKIGETATYDLANSGKNDPEIMQACCEAESANYWKQPEGSRICAAPYYFERLAILHRKAKDYSAEIAICEQWKAIINDYKSQPMVKSGRAALVHKGSRSESILTRMKKARDLLKKQ